MSPANVAAFKQPSCWLPSMFVWVQEHTTVGVVEGFVESSSAITPVVTDQWFSVLSSVFIQLYGYAPVGLS